MWVYAMRCELFRIVYGMTCFRRNQPELPCACLHSKFCGVRQRGKTCSSLSFSLGTGGAGPVTAESERAALTFSDVLAGSSVSDGSTIDKAACFRTFVLRRNRTISVLHTRVSCSAEQWMPSGAVACCVRGYTST